MRYGICFGIEYADRVYIAKKAGFDYVEGGFCTLSRGSDEIFEAYKKALFETGLKCEAANGFLPGDLVLFGDGYNEEGIKQYIENGLKRGSQIGLKKIVFGSSKARSIPDGMIYTDSFKRLGEILRDVVAPLCDQYGVTIITEPLRKNECNFINTIKEGAMLAAISGKNCISTLGDIYHMVGEGDSFDDVRQLKGCIKHCHISNPNPESGFSRTFPFSLSEFDYKGFLDAMNDAGCESCSVEAQTNNFEADAMICGPFLKTI